MDTKYLDKAKREIEQWESQGPGFLSNLSGLIMLPAEMVAKTLIPLGLQAKVSKAVQGVLGGLSSVTQLAIDSDKIRYLVEQAYNDCGNDLQAADTVSKQYWQSGVTCAAGEGGLTGAIGLFGLAADVPALLTVSLRLIRQVGTCYGYDVKSDREQEYLMHILRVGSTSNFKVKAECLVGLKHVEQILLRVTSQQISEELARREISRLSLLAAMHQFAQRLGIQLTRRKALQMVPVIGAVVGASFNALFVNDVGRAAYMTYRRRRIAELESPNPTTKLELI